MRKKGKLLLTLAGTAVLLGFLFRILIWSASSPAAQIPAEPAETAQNEGRQARQSVIVIDAGHGGMDGGASSTDGIFEKDINLAIARYLQKEMEGYPLQVVMTREEDCGLYTDDDRPIRAKKREDLLNRKKMIEKESVTLGISIHLNSFPENENVYGAQVFYPKETGGQTAVPAGTFTSREAAEAVQKALETNISDGRERSAMSKSDILLFENPTGRVILVECGFLSNPRECELLQKAEYQQLLAASIWEGVNEILCLEKTKNIEVIYSANKA